MTKPELCTNPNCNVEYSPHERLPECPEAGLACDVCKGTGYVVDVQTAGWGGIQIPGLRHRCLVCKGTGHQPEPDHVPNWRDMVDPANVTRFEVIDGNGRRLVEYNVKVRLEYQDGGRTLKVFMEERS